MDRLHRELHRLYAPRLRGEPDARPGLPELVAADGRLRAIVLELARPADWDLLAVAWKGVQTELELPPPAIAVNGRDAYQLWFSLAEPLPADQALAFAEALRRRYLAEVRVERVGRMPWVDPALPQPVRHAAAVPAPQAGTGRWSAFVAPDLAPVFAAEPWLELPPNPEGQARLLAGLASIPVADFQRALARLQPAVAPVQEEAAACSPGPADAAPVDLQAAAADAHRDPRRFLFDVMHDARVPLALRIEAAKALLPGFTGPQRP